MGDLSRRVPTQGSSDEFDRLARTINTMLEQIEHLIEGVRNASNVVAHDLRTPLAELRTRLETLLRTRPPLAETYDEIQDAVADIDRIVNIFNALLRLAEIDSGVRRAGFRRVELAGVTTELAELYEPLAEDKHVALTVDAPEDGGARRSRLLAQAIGNLVDNAIKYTPCGMVRWLCTSCRLKDRVQIVRSRIPVPVSPEADKPRVTERFYRGNRARGPKESGLVSVWSMRWPGCTAGALSLTDNCPGLVATLMVPRMTELFVEENIVAAEG